MNGIKFVTWMLVLALFLASCTNGDTNPADDATQAPSTAPVTTTGAPGTGTTGGYPYPAQAQVTVASVDSAYPSPVTAQATPTLVPTPLTLRPPASGKANIHGILTSGADKIPDVTDLLLAKAVQADKPGFAPMLSYSDENSPRAVQDKTGLFVFFDVDPGQYGLVISNPMGGTTINDPTINPPAPLLIIVKAGDDKDVGTLNTP